LSYNKFFTQGTATTLSLNGNTLTLSGSAALDGTITSGGLVKATGTGHLNGLELDNGLNLSITGAYNETGSIVLGNTGSGTVTIGAAGSLRLVNDSSIFTGLGGGVLVNNGMLVKAGGTSHGAESVIYAAFTNGGSATVAVNSGTLDFHGPSSGFTSTLAGTYTGAGTLSFDAGSFLIAGTAPTLTVSRLLLAQSANMTLTTALTYGGFWDQTGGTLVVGSPGQGVGALTLTGETALDGGLLKGTGTVLASGAVNLGAGVDLEGNLTFTFGTSGVAGTVSQTGSINLGLQTDAITVANVTANETWALAGNSEILGFNGEINNAGTFAKVSGAFDSVVQSGINNTGTLAVDAGTLTLSGVGTLGGSVTGAASLDISGAYKFANNLLLTVGEVILDNPAQPNEVQATLGGDLTYGNDWSQDGGTLALGGHTLTLTGVASLLTGSAVEGSGTIVTNGSALLGGISLLQGADIVVNGTCDQVGNVTLTGGSTAPTLTINGTYTMEPGDVLGGPSNSVVGNVVVDSGGTLVAAGSGLNNGASETIAAGVLDNGKISLSHGEMQFLGSISGTGVLSISNGATLDLLGSTSITNAVSFGSGGAILDLGTPDDFTGMIKGFATGDMVELTGFAFGSVTPVINGNTVTLTETSGQSVTLTFSSAQTASQLMVGEGPHGWLSLIHL
ncbi:MAG TPA: hypothetical protein VMB71_03385, partial [Acetobacteraceae bacterium]|nr:hypothetical protein [Acetobacteraceae bacterium]